MLPFCEPGDGESIVWRENGLSRCFATIVGSLTASGVIIIFGLTLVVLNCEPAKAKTRSNTSLWQLLVHSKTLMVEILVCFLMSLTYAVELILHGVLLGGSLYGYVIVSNTTGFIAWLFCISLITRERYNVLYGLHHSVPIILFWLVSILWLVFAVVSWGNSEWWWSISNTVDIVDVTLFGIRSVSLFLLVCVGVVRPLMSRRTQYRLLVNFDEATRPPIASQSEEDHIKAGGFSRKSSQGSTFGGLWKKIKLLFPYVWPKGHFFLQLQVVICFLILASGRVINVYVPIFYKRIVNALTPNRNLTERMDLMYGITHNSYGITFPIASICIYVFLKFLQGGSVGSAGFVNNIRTFLWINVQQYTSRALQVDLFRHLHSLSLRWHLGRKTGEILRVIDRGTQSMNNLLSYVLFNILPTFVDVGIAIIYFVISFDAWFGLIVFTTMTGYLLFTVYITEWRTKYRRIMNERDNETRAKAVDSLINFETVKYYGREEYEVERFKAAILKYQRAEWESLASLNILGLGQNMIITAGLLVGSLLCAYRVEHGRLNVGDFVLFGTYIIQLYAPLNFFGTYYRLIQQAFIDMENIIDLLDVQQEIKDEPDAQPLKITTGCIEFRNVYFHYNPEKPILRDITFTVHPGETVALVGPSGAGKSTIIRLLFRFYDIQDGMILIDGQDIRTVQQSSLRQTIGVVPQDTVLFNDIIRYNIRYGKVGADDKEVEKAAEYADIHERILTFPQKYTTVVGERGLKLSGGEKQRVAIARTILKNPSIILLDEATSALDTHTERNIQSSLMKVCQGRSTIIVAHRLSTIIHANQILVLKDGVVCEQGTHYELLSFDGVYAAMWAQQQQSLEEYDENGRGLEEPIKGKETNL